MALRFGPAPRWVESLSSEEEHKDELTEEEREEQAAEFLPERDQPSVIQPISPMGGGHTIAIEPRAKE